VDIPLPLDNDLNLGFQNAVGHELSIPMPGHPIPPTSVDKTKKDIAVLEKLFDEHDAIFLLMDSRESRWLPTVMGASKGKVRIAALSSSWRCELTHIFRSCSTLRSVSIRTW